jgi:hypothetical protein
LYLLLFNILLSNTGYAEQLNIKGEFKNEESFYSLSNSPLNPENILEVSTFDSISLLFLEPRIFLGDESFLKGLFSGKYRWQSNDHSKEDSEVEVKELYFSTLYKNLSMDIGREKVRWGVGYVASPTDVVTNLRKPDDPEDRLTLVKGTDIIKVDFLHGDSSLGIVYIPDLELKKFQINNHSVAIRYYTFIKGLDISTVLLLSEDKKTKAGINSSYVVDDALELHGEFLWSRRQSGLYPDYSLGYDALYAESPYRYSENPAYSGLLGGQYTLNFDVKGVLNIVLEYYRNGDGLSREEIRDYTRHIEYSHDLPDTQGYYQLGWASEIYRFPLGRDYLFLRLDYLFPHNNLKAELNTAISLTDGSIFSQPILTWDVDDNLSLYIRGMFNWGDNESEAYLAPIDSAIRIGGSYSF